MRQTDLTRNLEIVRLYKNYDFTQRQLAERFDTTQVNISYILKKYNATKPRTKSRIRKTKSRIRKTIHKKIILLPCRRSERSWPKCYGVGCYWAKPGKCSAFEATRGESVIGLHSTGHPDKKSTRFYA